MSSPKSSNEYEEHAKALLKEAWDDVSGVILGTLAVEEAMQKRDPVREARSRVEEDPQSPGTEKRLEDYWD